MTREERRRLDGFEAGDLVRFEKAYKGMGVARGDVLTVVKVEESWVVLAKPDGGRVNLEPYRLNGANFTVGVRVEREMAVGDAVRFTATDREIGFKNGWRGIVEAVDRRRLILRTTNGEIIKIEQGRVLPLDYAYAATGHSAQGLGAERVLLEKETTAITTNYRSFYTDLTRAQQEAAVYANDRKALPDAAARLSDKTCALDVVGRRATQLEREEREKTAQREYGR